LSVLFFVAAVVFESQLQQQHEHTHILPGRSISTIHMWTGVARECGIWEESHRMWRCVCVCECVCEWVCECCTHKQTVCLCTHEENECDCLHGTWNENANQHTSIHERVCVCV